MRDSVVMFVAVLSSIFGVKLGKSTGKDAEHVVDILACASVVAIWVWAMYLCALRAGRDQRNRSYYYALFYPVFFVCGFVIWEMCMVIFYGTDMGIYVKSIEVGAGSFMCMWLWGTLEELRSALGKAMIELFAQPLPTSAAHRD